MPHSEDVTATIRRHLSSQPPASTAHANYDAVLAVLEKCEQIRRDNDEMPAGVGRYYAHEFEQAIARALGITS